MYPVSACVTVNGIDSGMDAVRLLGLVLPCPSGVYTIDAIDVVEAGFGIGASHVSRHIMKSVMYSCC